MPSVVSCLTFARVSITYWSCRVLGLAKCSLVCRFFTKLLLLCRASLANAGHSYSFVCRYWQALCVYFNLMFAHVLASSRLSVSWRAARKTAREKKAQRMEASGLAAHFFFFARCCPRCAPTKWAPRRDFYSSVDLLYMTMPHASLWCDFACVQLKLADVVCRL